MNFVRPETMHLFCNLALSCGWGLQGIVATQALYIAKSCVSKKYIAKSNEVK
jgi:hypothetical protein